MDLNISPAQPLFLAQHAAKVELRKKDNKNNVLSLFL